jgi:hypothetical protein
MLGNPLFIGLLMAIPAYHFATPASTIPVSAYGCAGVCPAYSERQNAMQEARVIKSVMPGRSSELLALRDFGIGVRFNEIQGAVGREAKIDARVSIEPQCPVDAFRCSLNAGA